MKHKDSILLALSVMAVSLAILIPGEALGRGVPFTIIIENNADEYAFMTSAIASGHIYSHARLETTHAVGYYPREILHITYGYKVCEVPTMTVKRAVRVVLEDTGCTAYNVSTTPRVLDNGEVQLNPIPRVKWRDKTP